MHGTRRGTTADRARAAAGTGCRDVSLPGMLRSDGRPHHGHTKEMLFLLTGQRVHAKDAASITTNFSRIASHCALSTDWLIFGEEARRAASSASTSIG